MIVYIHIIQKNSYFLIVDPRFLTSLQCSVCVYNYGFRSNGGEQPANLILGEDKIGFIFLDCRGNTPGGKSTSTAGPGTGQRKQKNFNHFATVQEQLNDYSMPS